MQGSFERGPSAIARIGWVIEKTFEPFLSVFRGAAEVVR